MAKNCKCGYEYKPNDHKIEKFVPVDTSSSRKGIEAYICPVCKTVGKFQDNGNEVFSEKMPEIGFEKL